MPQWIAVALTDTRLTPEMRKLYTLLDEAYRALNSAVAILDPQFSSRHYVSHAMDRIEAGLDGEAT